MEQDHPIQEPVCLPDNYPQKWVEQVSLRGGMPVLLRPIRPDDGPRLLSGFKQLSPRSVYLRFLEPYRELPEKLVHSFTHLDYHTRMALVAEIQEAGQPRLIGVARYALVHLDDPQAAESAVVVIDEYQRHGLGTILMDLLIQYAVEQGVAYFTAMVHHTNGPVQRLIERSGMGSSRRMIEPGVWEVRICLENEGAYEFGN